MVAVRTSRSTHKALTKPTTPWRLSCRGLCDALAGGYMLYENAGTVLKNFLPNPYIGDATIDPLYASWAAGHHGPALRTSSLDLDAPAILPDSPDPGWWHDAFSERTILFHGKLEEDTNGAQSLWEIGGSVNGFQLCYRIAPDTLDLTVAVSSTDYSIDSTDTFVPGDEIVAVAVYNGTAGVMKLFVNGRLNGTLAVPSSVPAHTDQPAISSEDGGSAVPASYNFGGLTYSFIAWDRALSDEEAEELSLFPYAIFSPHRTWFLLGAGAVLLSSSPSASGAESSQLALLRALSASQAAAGSESALLGRLRPVSASPAASGSQSSDLPVLRALSASQAAYGTQTAGLSLLVSLGTSQLGAASIAADLLVSSAGQVLLSASIAGAGSEAADLAILRSLLLSSSGALSVSPSLTAERGLGAAPAGAATLSAVTALLLGLSSSPSGALAHTADLFVGVPLASSPAAAGTLSGALAPVRGLALDGVVTASLSALTALVRSFAAGPSGSATLSALLTGPALLLGASLAGSASLGAVLVHLWEPSPPSGGSWTPTAPVSGVWTLVTHPPVTWS